MRKLLLLVVVGFVALTAGCYGSSDPYYYDGYGYYDNGYYYYY